MITCSTFDAVKNQRKGNNMCVGNIQKIIGTFGVVVAWRETRWPGDFHWGQRAVANSAGKSSS